MSAGEVKPCSEAADGFYQKRRQWTASGKPMPRSGSIISRENSHNKSSEVKVEVSLVPVTSLL